jgi:hypothetical protein
MTTKTALKRTLHIIPGTESSCEIHSVSEKFGNVLPTLGIRSFEHHSEIVVVDLAGNPVHTIVIRQNGDVEVDK